jgi:Putative auto-transporter adhesin, head GIN domain
MKNVILFSLFSLLSFCAFHGPRVEGNGTIKTDAREISAFESIVCDGGYEVHITCQAQQSVAVESDENILPYIKTEVNGKTLRIYTKGDLSPSRGIRITIAVPHLEEFTVNGSAEGDIQNIRSDSFALSINGSSQLRLDGSADKVKIHISGSGKIDADSLSAGEAKMHIEGSGSIECRVANLLDARIDGSGNIKYFGEPKTVRQSVNGSGSIEKE